MVENAFGMLTSCFRLFQSPLQRYQTPAGQQGCHGLPSTAQTTEDQTPHRSTGRLWEECQLTIVLNGNDIPYEGYSTIGAAKRQRNILRDYFMNEG